MGTLKTIFILNMLSNRITVKDVCQNWLQVRDICHFDTACCNKVVRKNLFLTKTIIRNVVSIVANADTIKWMELHHMALEKLCFHGIDLIQKLGAMFPTDNASNIRTLSISVPASCDNEWIRKLVRCCPMLRTLLLRDHSELIDSDIAELVASCPLLTEIDVSNCYQLTDNSLASISEKCEQLQKISVSGCTYMSDKGLCTLLQSHIGKLTHVEVSFCIRITDKSIICIGETQKRLETLLMKNCHRVTDDGVVSMLQQCEELREIDICHCLRLTEVVLATMQKCCPKLELISIMYISRQAKMYLPLQQLFPTPNNNMHLKHIKFGPLQQQHFQSGNQAWSINSSIERFHLNGFSIFDNYNILVSGLREFRYYIGSIYDREILGVLQACPLLEVLCINYTDFSDTTMEYMVRNNLLLRHLELGFGRYVSSAYLGKLSELPNVTSLCLRVCNMNDAALTLLATSEQRLATLSVDYNGTDCVTLDCSAFQQRGRTVISKTLTKLSLYGINLLNDEDLSHCKHLEYLDVRLNRMEGDASCVNPAVVEAITAHCKELSYWNLMRNPINRQAAAYIGTRCLQLRSLFLPTNSICDDCVSLLVQDCAFLEKLQLTGVQTVTDEALFAIAERCKLIRELEMGRCKLITDDGLTAIATFCSHLRIVNVQYCIYITNASIQMLALHCPALEQVYVDYCTQISNLAIIQLIDKCCNLKTIGLNSCELVTAELLGIMLKMPHTAHLLELYICDCPHVSFGSISALRKAMPYLSVMTNISA